MKLITETTEDVTIVTEAIEGGTGKNYFIEGIFMSYDIKNRNGRIYPKSVLLREMASFKSEKIDRKRSLGELGHSNGPSVVLERASHIITDLWNESCHVFGKAKILDTPYGKIAKNLIDEGAQLGVSTRGLGNIRQTPQGNFVSDDYKLSTIDIVSDPSAPDAFVNGIMEGREFVYLDNGILVEKEIEQIKKNIHATASKKALHEQMVREFSKFLSKLG